MLSPSDTLEPDHEPHPPTAGPFAPFRRIAACVDGSPVGEIVVRHATAIAAVFGVPLTVLRVLETGTNAEASPLDPLDWGVRQREARAYLERLVSLASQPDIDVQAELIHGRAAEQLCGWASKHGADLTVLSSHGEHGRAEWTLASTARKLVETVPGSLLLVPATGDYRTGRAVHYHRIMVPLDGSARAESVLPIASRLTLACGAELLIAHVTPAPELTRVGPLTAQDLELEQRVIARNDRVARSYLEQIRARMAEVGITVRTIVSRSGDARTRLARLVRREGVDLVVLSAHGRGGPRETPCGSVAAHLLTHVAAPLLVLRERPRRVTRRLSHDAVKETANARPPAQSRP